MTKQLTPFKMPASGEEIVVFPISVSSLTMQLRREQPEPKPPVVTVNIAGTVMQERNAADPDYAKAYERWDSLLQLEVAHRVCKRIALKQSLTQEQKEAVAQHRKDLEGESLHPNDKIVWFFDFAIGADSDIGAMMDKIRSITDPQEEAIKANANGF